MGGMRSSGCRQVRSGKCIKTAWPLSARLEILSGRIWSLVKLGELVGLVSGLLRAEWLGTRLIILTVVGRENQRVVVVVNI